MARNKAEQEGKQHRTEGKSKSTGKYNKWFSLQTVIAETKLTLTMPMMQRISVAVKSLKINALSRGRANNPSTRLLIMLQLTWKIKSSY